MIKSVLIYLLVFSFLFFVSYTIHENYLENKEIILPFLLKKVYHFHLGFSLLICINFKIFSSVDKIFEQLGFIYLGTLFLKITIFCIIFYQPIFGEEILSQTARISLLIPLLIFLLTEVIFVAKILNEKQ